MSSCPVYRGIALANTWFDFNMADKNTEEVEANQSTLALDSNKQREFEDKVKGISAQVNTQLCLSIIKRQN